MHTRGSVVGLIHPVILVSLTEEPRQGCSVTHETYVICPPPAPCASLAPRALGAVALCPAPWDLHPVPCAGGILVLAAHTSSCLNSSTRTLTSCTALVLLSTVPRGFYMLTLLLCTRRGSPVFLGRAARSQRSSSRGAGEPSSRCPLLSRAFCAYTSLKLRICRARTHI